MRPSLTTQVSVSPGMFSTLVLPLHQIVLADHVNGASLTGNAVAPRASLKLSDAPSTAACSVSVSREDSRIFPTIVPSYATGHAWNMLTLPSTDGPP